jgi:glycosyltransferase involved in cell wall biosynthesis
MGDLEQLTIVSQSSSKYPRNQAFLKAFKRAFPHSLDFIVDKGSFKNLRLILKFLIKFPVAKDILFLWPANYLALSIFAAKLMGKRIIYDAFTSMYDSLVNDRKTIKPGSIRSYYYYLQDYLCCHLADKLIFDTQGHKDYFFKTFKLKSSQPFVILPVSVDLDFIEQQPAFENKDSQTIKVLFYGSFIPLQGIEYILQAIQLTKDLPIRYSIIGNGQTYRQMLELANRLGVNDLVAFIPPTSYSELVSHIKAADLCLGIFGDTEKAQRVIPNKVLECAACSKPVITGKNNDLAKFFTDKESILFCPMAEAHALAETIRWASANPGRWRSLGEEASRVIEKNFSLPILVDRIKNTVL